MDDPSSSAGGAALPRRNVEWDDKQRALMRGRKLQAEVVNQALRAGARLMLRVLWNVVISPLRRVRRRRKDAFALLTLDDRQLADIGLRRGDIQGIAYGVIPPEQVVPAAAEREAAPSAEITVLHPRRQDQKPVEDLTAAA